MHDASPPAGSGATGAPLGAVLAVCGWSGSGKTTLLEAAIPRLVARGLAVAVLKHDARGPDVDRPGKDSDRLFRAGADVVLGGPTETLERRRDARTFDALVADLSRRHDAVLVEGHKTTPLPKVWLATPREPDPPGDIADVLAVLPWGAHRQAMFAGVLDDWLPFAWTSVPVWAGVLVGGASSRMGTSKHLLTRGGVTLLERLVAALAPRVAGVALLGDGEAPKALKVLPFADDDVARWLMAERCPGRWAVVPSLREGMVEPLLALYEPQALPLLEAIAAAGVPAPRLVARHPKVTTLAPPDALRRAFFNVNEAADLAALDGE
jgi:molybdopterin-guanine dinucleotide biosynthesis protein MobB